MADDHPDASPGVSGGAAAVLLRAGRLLSRGAHSRDLGDVSYRGGRDAELFHRARDPKALGTAAVRRGWTGNGV
ncbi:hypothetical protein GCM10027187_72330 [Streptosporangium sandarakinum]|uniref:Uncharacterized protein n=1 Tax=Streptosporangium sandarakinum TaxID=1260955 RepID=A0A852UTC2_9ACTN|nr:hypothetical protein [Streptosporangium sandarakinum]NYF38513.1 hypothetical protein [Streptosporangium sandarakinum]